jgi:hypothetical protein
MIYVKFKEDNTSAEMRMDVPDEEKSGYVAVADNSLFGKRLIKTKTKVREFTAKEYADEAVAAEKRGKGIVIDNMAKSFLRDTAYLVEPDFYEDLTVSQRAEVKAYRDALRNISRQEQYPEYVEFPEKPNF